jgi:protein-disulfide isomerase
MRLGDPDAPVTLIEYASFTCPHCATFHQGAYKQLKEDYIDTGKINFVYREVYFDRYGLWASAIARCAGPDKFFGITDLIYKGQSDWARAGGPTEIVEELRKIGRLAGIENDQLESCLQDGDKLRTLVAWYQENTEEHGITSTPSFVLNGETITNMPYAEMSALIDEALGE